jgi:hypothetical protein
MTKCPHCGSDEGVDINVTGVMAYWVAFDGDAEASEFTRTNTPRTGKCAKCGKRLPNPEIR